MSWEPLIDPMDKRILDFLTELDIKRIRQFESKYVGTSISSKKLKIEKEILNIYLEAIERNKKKKRTLGDWLNEAEIKEIEQLREELIHSNQPFYYEGMIYQVYLNSISRQTKFKHEDEVREYIDLMKQSESNEEAERLATEIMNLLRTADG